MYKSRVTINDEDEALEILLPYQSYDALTVPDHHSTATMPKLRPMEKTQKRNLTVWCIHEAGKLKQRVPPQGHFPKPKKCRFLCSMGRKHKKWCKNYRLNLKQCILFGYRGCFPCCISYCIYLFFYIYSSFGHPYLGFYQISKNSWCLAIQIERDNSNYTSISISVY